jgi:hypothetical protein
LVVVVEYVSFLFQWIGSGSEMILLGESFAYEIFRERGFVKWGFVRRVWFFCVDASVSLFFGALELVEIGEG